MKRFLLKVILPLVVTLVMFFGGGELFLRSIPNDYKIQKEFMDTNSEGLRLLVLGSSSTSRGVLPRNLDIQPAYNCAYSARSMDYDYYILENYIDRMDSLEWVVLDMFYSKLWYKMAPGSATATYIKYYSIYWGVTAYKGFDYQYELSTSFTDIQGLKYKFKKSYLEYDGYQGGCDEVYNEQEWRLNAKSKLRQNFDDKVFEYNLSYLKQIIELCQKRNVNVLMMWIPVDKSMSDLFDDNRIHLIDSTMCKLQREYTNFWYYSLLNDPTFTNNDMMNVDHLNRQGAIKLTTRINNCIDNIIKQ